MSHLRFTITAPNSQCMYCATALDEATWHTEHHHNQMYKSCACPSCTRRIVMPMNFLGSGHDHWVTWDKQPGITMAKTKDRLSKLEWRVEILSSKNMSM